MDDRIGLALSRLEQLTAEASNLHDSYQDDKLPGR